MNYSLSVPCLLGLEGPIAEELRRMGLADVAAENGRVNFSGGAEAIARANINLRVGERVLLELGRFQALTFDELFEGTRALPWESIIPRDGVVTQNGPLTPPSSIRPWPLTPHCPPTLLPSSHQPH